MDEKVARSSGRSTRAKRVDYKKLSQVNIIESPPSRPRKNKLGDIWPKPEIKEEPRDENQDSDATKSAEEELPNEPISNHSDIELVPPRSRVWNYALDMEECFADHIYSMPGLASREQGNDLNSQFPEGEVGYPDYPSGFANEDKMEEDGAAFEESVKQEAEVEDDYEGDQQLPADMTNDKNKSPRSYKSSRAFSIPNQRSCVHCARQFIKINRGYRRNWIENVLPSSKSGLTGLELLEILTGKNLSPPEEHLRGHFLCSSCWRDLTIIAKARHVLTTFFEKTGNTCYLKTKRPSSSSRPGPSKKQRSDSFPAEQEDGDGATATAIGEMLSNFTLYAQHGVDERDLLIKQLREENDRLKNELDELKLSPKPKGTKPYRFQKNRPTLPTSTKWDTIVRALHAGQYRRAISNIYNATPGTKKHFVLVAKRIVRKEALALSKVADFPLNQKFSCTQPQWLSWDKIISMAAESAPLLTGVLKGAVSKSRLNENLLSRGPKHYLKPKLCVGLSVLLNCRAALTCNFLQTLLSVLIYPILGQSNQGTLTFLSRLGLCINPAATVGILDRIKTETGGATPCLQEDSGNCLLSKMSTHREKDEIVARLLASFSNSTADELEPELKAMEQEDVAEYGDCEETDLAVDDEDEDAKGEEENTEEECDLDMEVEEAEEEEEDDDDDDNDDDDDDDET